jgi:urease accessory protein
MYVDTSSFDLGAAAPSPRLQRANGRSRVTLRHRDGATRLERLYQEGSTKVRLPRPLGGTACQAVLINTAGGLTGGDVFSTEVTLRQDAQAVFSTQACERIYKSAGGAADVSTRIKIASGARLDWLPQETILFDGGHVTRRLEADLARDAVFVAVEAVIFGRRAMGETVRSGSIRDRWRIRREGRLVFADELCIEGNIAGQLARPAVLAGGSALATLLYAGPEPERLLDPLRDAIGGAGGASAWGGKLVARLAAADGFALRRSLLPGLSVLMAGRPLPKVWQL